MICFKNPLLYFIEITNLPPGFRGSSANSANTKKNSFSMLPHAFRGTSARSADTYQSLPHIFRGTSASSATRY